MSIQEFISKLKSDDIGVVKNTQKELAEMLKSYWETLLKAYSQESESKVKNNIIQVFIMNPVEDAIQELIGVFQEEKEENLKFMIAIALGKSGNEKIIRHLVKLFSRNDFLLCHKIMFTLSKTGRDDIISEEFASSEGAACYYLKETLKKMEEKSPEPFYGIIENGDEKHMIDAFEVLGTIRTKENVIRLVEYLGNSDSSIRYGAEKALVVVGESIAEFLGSELKKVNAPESYSLHIPRVLRKYGVRGNQVMTDILRHADISEATRISIIKNIEYGDGVVPLFIEMIPNLTIEGQLEISKALARFGEEASSHFYKTLYENEDKNVKAVILSAMCAIPQINTNVMNEIYSLPEEELLREMLKFVLSEVKPRNAYNIYVDMLKSSDFFERLVSINIIENMRLEDYRFIMESMGTSNSGIGAIIIDIFRKNRQRFKNMLIDLMKTGTDSLKISAVFVIGELKLEEACDDLIEATKDGNEWVRKYAYRALVNIKGEGEAQSLAPHMNE
ncbi:MAG: HEAT repeat domain-containing protein [Candidatus Muiribacteriaceae bacterium]